MTQFYSDPSRESDHYALPDAEVFYAAAGELEWEGQDEASRPGYYYWFCFPGCMPEGDPTGPYDTEEKAIAAARESC